MMRQSISKKMSPSLSSTEPPRVCLGVITSPHGIRGGVKIKTYTQDPQNLTAYGPLSDETGKLYTIYIQDIRTTDSLTAIIDGVTDRNGAELLRGVHLFVDRDRLPKTDEEEFYHSDLINLMVKDVAGAEIGYVKAVHNFGAGDILEVITSNRASYMVPFRKEFVPTVDITCKQLVITAKALLTFDQTSDDEGGVADTSPHPSSCEEI